MTTKTETEKDQVIANLHKSWTELHHGFVQTYQENRKMQSFILLYALDNDQASRSEIDTDLAREFPHLWKDIQEWRYFEESHPSSSSSSVL